MSTAVVLADCKKAFYHTLFSIHNFLILILFLPEPRIFVNIYKE